MGEEDYREVSAFLRALARRIRMLKGAEGLCLISAAIVLILALGLGVKEIKDTLPYAPLAYSLLAVATITLLVISTAFQCARSISREWAARYTEERQPALRNNLISSIQLYPRVAEGRRGEGISVSMVLALLHGTRMQLRGMKAADITHTGRLKAELRLLAVLLVPVLALVLLHPSSVGESFSLLIHPLKDLPPSRTFIDVRPKGIRVVRGSAVTVEAITSGVIPESLDLVLSSRTAEGNRQPSLERLPMEGQGEGRFIVTVPHTETKVHYRAVTGPFASPWYTIEPIDLPEIANVKITLYPPQYTGLPTRTFRGGNIEGLKGSTLRVEARSTQELTRAKILLEGGREVPLKVEGKKLEGSLVLLQSQKYQILAETPHGFHNSPISYELRVLPDRFPTVELLRPNEDLEVDPDEALMLEFSARDDFGIQKITLVTRARDREERYPVHGEEGKRVFPRQRFQWDLARLGLQEGEDVLFHLEVLDNDTVSGPKTGFSRTLRLRLSDLRAAHNRIADSIRDLSRRMVGLLADHLETPPRGDEQPLLQTATADEAFRQKVAEIMRRIEEVIGHARRDRLSDYATWSDLQSLKRNLRFTRDDLLRKKNEASSPEEKEKLHDEISSELERMSLLAEDIGRRLAAQEVASTAQDLIKSQERLLDSLEKLRGGGKGLDAVLKEISKLARQLQSLQQSLSRLASRLPEEFMNSEALRRLRLDNMLSALDKLRKKLAQGDVKGAIRLARELFNQLASLVASLRNAQQMAMSSMAGRMQGEMMRSASEMERIRREQQGILAETEGVYKEGMVRREKILKADLERFQNRARRQLSRLAQLFPEEEREDREEAVEERRDEVIPAYLFKDLLARLKKRDFTGLAKGMDLALNGLRKGRGGRDGEKKQRAEATLKRLSNDLGALLRKRAISPSNKEKKNLRDLSYRQGLLKEQTEELHEKLNSLFQLFPSLDPKITRNIREAASSMGEARGRLGDLDAERAIPPEQEAVERLARSSQQMQSSMERLVRRGQLGRIPLVYLFRGGRFIPSGRLFPLPGTPQFPPFDAKGGVTGLDTEKFQFPGKDDYKAPRRFREEILEALREGVPDQFKEQIESYFKELSR